MKINQTQSLLVISEMQMKNTRYHFIFTRNPTAEKIRMNTSKNVGKLQFLCDAIKMS